MPTTSNKRYVSIHLGLSCLQFRSFQQSRKVLWLIGLRDGRPSPPGCEKHFLETLSRTVGGNPGVPFVQQWPQRSEVDAWCCYRDQGRRVAEGSGRVSKEDVRHFQNRVEQFTATQTIQGPLVEFDQCKESFCDWLLRNASA